MEFIRKLYCLLFCRSNGIFTEEDNKLLCTAMTMEAFSTPLKAPRAVPKLALLEATPADEQEEDDGIEVEILPQPQGYGNEAMEEDVFVELPANQSVPLLGNSFYAGTSLLIAGKNGTGKTLLAIELVREGFKKGLIHKLVVFSLEDDGQDSQKARWNVALEGRNIKVITAAQWDAHLSEEREHRENSTLVKAVVYQGNPKARQFHNDQKSLLREEGLDKKEPLEMRCFKEWLRRKLKAGADAVVVDSLPSIYPNLQSIAVAVLESVMAIVRESGKAVTFLVLSQTTGENKIFGPAHVIRSFQSAYVLSVVDKADSATIIRVNVEKSRHHVEERDFLMKRIKVTDLVARHEVVDDDAISASLLKDEPSNIPTKLWDILQSMDTDEVSFTDTFARLREAGITEHEEVVKNALRDLVKKGYVAKVNGKWDKIRIIR
jgi:KaiC/GvpD/RAD55 family RecA-like ATPase